MLCQIQAAPPLTGRLYFGPIETQFDPAKVANDPFATGVPDPEFPGDGVTSALELTDQSGRLPGHPEYTFGDGSALAVHIFANGDARYLGATDVPLAGSSNGSLTSGHCRIRFARLVVSKEGLAAFDTQVLLPQGVGIGLSPGSRRLLGQMPLGRVTLDGNLQITVPSLLLEASKIGLASVWWHHDQLSVLLRTPRIEWRPAENTFIAAAGTWEFARAARHEALDQLAARRQSGADVRGETERLSNDLVFRNPGAALAATVRVTEEGLGLLEASVPLGPTKVLAHFPGAVVPIDAGQLVVNDSVIDRTASQVEVGTTISLIYSPNCPESDCPGAQNPPRLISFTPKDGRLRLTADAGLSGDGTVPGSALAWGNPAAGQYAQETGPFTEAAFAMAGITLRGAMATQPDNWRAAELLLSGFDAPGQLGRIERPGSAGYVEGLANYAGINVRSGGGGVTQGSSRLGGVATGPYALHESAKYLVRFAGVSGRHQSLAFQSQLRLLGFATTFQSLGLAFLDNEVVDSRTSGSVHVPGPADIPAGPSGFDLPFAQLQFDCRGYPGPAEAVAENDPKALAYWLTTFQPLSIGWEVPTNTPACSLPDSGFLVVGAEVPLPLLKRPVTGVLAFRPNGDLATAADGSRVDSRLHLPSALELAGPGASRWRLTGPRHAYFNRWTDPARPAEGFVNFFAALDVPFFQDIKVQVHSRPGLGAIGVSLMGGWHARDGAIEDPAAAWLEGKETPFTKQSFDAANRGYTGPSVDAYRDPATVAFNPRAEQDWAGILHFDEPLQWRAAEGGFRNDGSLASAAERTLLFQLERRVKSLNAAGAEITFGIEPKLPRLSPNQMLLDAVDSRTGLHRDLVAAIDDVLGSVRDRSGLVRAADRLDELVSIHPDALLRPALHSALRPLAHELVRVLQPAYEAAVRNAQAAGQDTAGQANAARKEVCDLFQPLNGAFTERFDEFQKGTALVTDIAHRIDAVLNDVEDGLTNVLIILGRHPVPDAIPPREERRVMVELGRRFATPDRLGEYGAIVGNEFAAHLADSMQREYLPQLEPAFAEIERQVRDIHGQLAAIHAQFKAVSGPVVGTLDEIVTQGTEVQQWFGGISNVVCRTFEVPMGAPEAFFRETAPAVLEERFLMNMEDEFLRRLFDERLSFLFRASFGEARGVFRGALDEAFAHLNEMVRRELDAELLKRALPIPDSDVVNALDELDRSLQGTRVRGHARINTDSLEELRLDGHFQFGLYGIGGGGPAAEGIEFDAWCEAHQYQGDSPAQGCREAGVAAATVEVGARFTPGGGFAAGLPVGLSARASFAPGGQLLGLGGGILLAGSKDLAGASLRDPSLQFSFGKEGHYLAGVASLSVREFAGSGTLFVGEACRLSQLGIADADLERVLLHHGVDPNGRIRGFWARSDGTFPLERLLPIPPLGCLLHLEGRGSIGYYLLVANDSPFTATVGTLVRKGISARYLCVLNGTGEVTLLGGATLTDVLSGSGPYVIGHGFVEGSVLGAKRREDFEFNARLVRRGNGFDAEFHVPLIE